MKTNSVIFHILVACLAALPFPAFSQEENEEELLRKAAGYFFQKKFDMAESYLQQIIERNPDNAQACAYLGDIFLIKKRYDGALELYQKCVEINPKVAENYFRIGQIYYYKKDGKLAVENFKKAIETDPQLTYAYYHIGLSHLMILRDKNNTITNWETYIKVAPDDPQYDRIKRAIELLKDPNFTLPPPGSEMTIEEALMLGGMTIDRTVHKTTDKEAGHESKKTKRKLEDIYMDDDL
ncbi:MAG: tetratricopeptide repeat protein [Spirochaetes bacterium]|nr:tetratricopeptide repeat protein [Spirochaetota bacterium]